MMMIYIIMAVIAYAIGSINFSVIFSRKFAGFDIREKGSGNAGTTNMLRSVGKKAAAITLVCDILKGILVIFIAYLFGKFIENLDKALLVQIAGICVAIGHTFPIFFEFRGGKGVATSLGILLVVNWQIGLICLMFAVIIMALTRMVSLGSIMAAILYPVLVIFGVGAQFFVVDGNYVIFSILLAAIVLFNHKTNIKRIMAGEENRLSFNNNSK